MPFDNVGYDEIVIDLYNARDRIEQGWCKGKLNDTLGNVCLVGAFGIDEELPNQMTPALNLLLDMVWTRFLYFMPRQLRLELWNDSRKDKSAILALLDHAIAQREQRVKA
jgi:hypothetical protein